MWFLTRLAVIFYVSIIWSSSVVVLLFVAHIFSFNDVSAFFRYIYDDTKAGTIAAAVTAVVMFMSFMLARLIFGKQYKQRTIAFDNPGGQVSVSLTAMEDMIRRLIVQTPEVREIRPQVIATKKGLDVDIRLVLKSAVNIPEMTARFQETVRNKIQEMVGIEGKVNIRIHVVKMTWEEHKGKRKDKGPFIDDSTPPHVPFYGYRA